MGTNYLLLETWLSGSLLLPFMLLVRWGGSKWRRLDWLNASRKRWLLVWGFYGFAKTIIFGLVLLLKYFPDFYRGFDFLGWEGAIVWRVILELNIRRGAYLIELLLGSSLKAVVDGAVDCGLAVVAWWVFSLLTQGAGAHRDTKTTARFGVSLLISACGIGIANVYHFSRAATCYDCFRPDGIPFTFFHEGGYAGGEGFVWTGVLEEAVFVLFVGMILGLIWNELALKRSNLRISTG